MVWATARQIRTNGYTFDMDCGGDSDVLRSMVFNFVQHYKNDHSDCHTPSRCKKDPKYETRRTVITDPIAEKLLIGVITMSTVFKIQMNLGLGKTLTLWRASTTLSTFIRTRELCLDLNNTHTLLCAIGTRM